MIKHAIFSKILLGAFGAAALLVNALPAKPAKSATGSKTSKTASRKAFRAVN